MRCRGANAQSAFCHACVPDTEGFLVLPKANFGVVGFRVLSRFHNRLLLCPSHSLIPSLTFEAQTWWELSIAMLVLVFFATVILS